MAIVYSDTLKTGRLQAMSDLVAGKVLAAATGSATAGKLVIMDASSVILVTINLPTTPFVVSGAGTVLATLQGTPLSGVAGNSGIASKAELRNNANTTIASGLTVGTSSADIILNSTSITSGQTVTVPAAPASTITHG